MKKFTIVCTYTDFKPLKEILNFNAVPRIGEFVIVRNKEYLVKRLIHDIENDQIEILLELTMDFSEI